VDRTIDDLSSAGDADVAVPAIIVVASGAQPMNLVLIPNADLGRKISAGNKTFDIDDERMSREHASVRYQRGVWTITDRGSHNGTWVDGARIAGAIDRRGDVVVRLGHTIFVLLADGRGHDNAADTGAGVGVGAGVGSGGEGVVVGPELARCYEQIRRYAGGDALLVYGESGAGKELAARLYHDSGPRRTGPFVAVNCAAIPAGVAERLLFGSRKGAFSGATDAIGHFQSADGGTLFLDEISELDPAVQAKLLRVLETREVVPIGASAGTTVDVGIVAACHRELRHAVAERRFRDDLYYRLARATVHVPPLRARKVDVARLLQRELAAVSPKLTAHAKLVEACLVRPWPGNVRELRAAIRRAATVPVAAGRVVVRREHLAPHAGLPPEPGTATPTGAGGGTGTGIGGAVGAGGDPTPDSTPRGRPAELDKAAVLAALERAGGVISNAARELGLHRTQLYRLMDKLGIARDDS
jgi:transcriptional regulator with GAF, ATPase, and Fis domain